MNVQKISEWKSLRRSFSELADKARKVRKNRNDEAQVRKMAWKLGHRYVDKKPVAEVLKLIRSGRPRAKMTWIDWSKRCQSKGIPAYSTNPADGTGRRLSIAEMRFSLLHKSSKEEVIDVATRGEISTSGKCKRALIKEILEVKDLC